MTPFEDYPYLIDELNQFIESSFLEELFKAGRKTNLKKGIFEFQHVYPKNERDEPEHIKPLGLSHQGVLQFLEYIGVRRITKGTHFVTVFKHRNIVEIVQPEFIKSLIRLLIESWGNISFSYQNCLFEIQSEGMLELFLTDMHKQINEKWLESVKELEVPFLQDTKDTSIFPFHNYVVYVTKDGISIKPYNEITDAVIWKKSIIKKPFELLSDDEAFEAAFANFLKNCCPTKDRFLAAMSSLGYLLHTYQIPSRAKAVLLFDEQITDKKTPMGGSGKSLFSKSLLELRNGVKIDGKSYDTSDRFKFQEIEIDTQIFIIDETGPKFKFDSLNSAITDGMNIEKKNQHKFFIPLKDSPKILISSNVIIDTEGSTRKRRQFILEFSPYYTNLLLQGIEEPVKYVHGTMFFSDEWDAKEWNRFYTFMLYCSRLYLTKGLIQYERVNLNKNRLLQETSSEFFDWVQNYNLKPNELYTTKELFIAFVKDYLGEDSSFKQRTFTNFIKAYAASINFKFELKRSNGDSKFQLTPL